MYIKEFMSSLRSVHRLKFNYFDVLINQDIKFKSKQQTNPVTLSEVEVQQTKNKEQITKTNI